MTDGHRRFAGQPKAASGDKAVAVMGGANIVQEVIAAGLVDELRIHPVVLAEEAQLRDAITRNI